MLILTTYSQIVLGPTAEIAFGSLQKWEHELPTVCF